MPYLSNNLRALLFNVASRAGPPNSVKTKSNVYFATPKPLPTKTGFLSTLKWGRRLIAKVYTHPLLPALLFRPGATFLTQTPVLPVGPSCVPPLPSLPSPHSTKLRSAAPFMSWGIPSNRLRARWENGLEHTFKPDAWSAPRKPQKGWGIPSNRLRARWGNGLGHTFTSDAWNDPRNVKTGCPEIGKRAGAYLHTFIPIRNERQESLTFFMTSIGILVCRYGFR